jgi:hypothetical protein
MDACSFFIIDHVVPAGSAAFGTLYAISGRGWEANCKMRGENDEHEYDRPPVNVSKQEHIIDMVFCSKTKPMFFGFYGGKWSGEQLRPGDPDAVFGYNESTYQFYWAACHNHITRDPYETALAKKLGYNFSGGFRDKDSGSELEPFDVLRYTAGQPVFDAAQPQRPPERRCSTAWLGSLPNCARASIDARLRMRRCARSWQQFRDTRIRAANLPGPPPEDRPRCHVRMALSRSRVLLVKRAWRFLPHVYISMP